MYHDIKDVYWWIDMKKNIAKFFAQCPSFQQVKVEHQKPGGLMKAIDIPTWKWEAINMDFVTGLTRSHRKFDSIWAIEKVKLIQERLLVAQSPQKSYSDMRRRDLEFEVNDWVFLKLSPMKGVMRFGKKGKLSPQYIGPYRIILRVDQVAYELEFPSKLEFVHPVFHVSILRKCIGDPSRVVPTDNVQITDDLSYEKVPVSILDRQIRKLQNKEVAFMKVLWKRKNVEEMTWKAEEEMKFKYPPTYFKLKIWLEMGNISTTLFRPVGHQVGFSLAYKGDFGKIFQSL
ncbi:uncharacterized protein [Nicotiana tomentosiformis]|uniref:uncharacterized protein n=1 Tax=Nicotiana tomentosiformis TaxID=4098 RepID=UPI00388CBED5